MLLLGLFSANSHGQDNGEKKGKIDREAYAAGKFYTSNPKELKEEMAQLFKKALPCEVENVRAIISPHAGYVYSGEVAATSYNQLDPDATYDNIFVIASSHRVAFQGASIYHQGDYKTPFGEVEVNRKLAQKLVDEHDIFTFRNDAHAWEHSLEVQLPFLQYHLKNEFRIVPIVVGARYPRDCEEIAKALKPWFTKDNLFVISTDFSHYPPYEEANQVDRETANAIVSNSVENLEITIKKNEKKGIRDLATCLCGWSSVYTLLYLTENEKNVKYKALQYMNSGDQPFGDKGGVVGYYAIVAFQEKADEELFSLTDKDKKDLLNIARSTVDSYVKKRKIPKIDTNGFSDAVKSKCGAFVTLNKDGQLRGCIGRFTTNEPLYDVVQQMAISSATQDYRFTPVDNEEVDELEIEISVLTPMRKIESIEEIELGRHGIYIKKDGSSGTFLPQVARHTNWTLEEFLGHCAKDKAGIGWEGWKDADIYIYEALVFEEDDFN